MTTKLNILKILFICQILNAIESKLRIVSPQNLIEKISKYEHLHYKKGVPETESNTTDGTISYVSAVLGKESYMEKALYRIIMTDDNIGCNEGYERLNLGKHLYNTAYLIKRVKCTSASIINNVKLADGDLAIVYEDKEYIDTKWITPVGEKNYSQESIPMISIGVEIGKQIHEELKSGGSVLISVSYENPIGIEAPKVKFWMNPMESETYDLALAFKPHYQRFFYNSIDFQPTMRFKSTYLENKSVKITKQIIDFTTKNCYSFGDYCIPQTFTIYRPQELIDEGLRQMCLWGQTSITSDAPEISPAKGIWFDYIKEWKDSCISTDKKTKVASIYRTDFSANLCSKMIAIKLSIDWDKLQKCVEESFYVKKINEYPIVFIIIKNIIAL